MAADREKEREAELESAMYTNCLLLGLDPAVIGVGAGGVVGSPRVGHFRHSNPRLGELLLHFLLSALRGPAQSAKDFDKVWPIFDSAQSRDFRKIVQGIISELESQGALPRSNARVSSLATCCGPRFVELLWQLSVHALREVHKRSFAADVASNPLPASLTDASYLHAAALLPVTKARIALERRKFLKNASIAVHRQAAWSNLANEMTAEFRALSAEEAYLQQELEKLQDLRNKAKLDGEMWDDRISSSSQSNHLVSKATRLWESLLSRKAQHEVLASGPIEDLIAHREHRYRISGTSLLAAMENGSRIPYPDLLASRASEMSSLTDGHEKVDSSQFQGNPDIFSRADDRGVRSHPTVDVAEVIRRWTHALQRVHKQSLQLAKANDGEGPELLRSTSDNGTTGGHAESLAATLAEHRQHLISIQGLINQLKEAVPAMQKSIAELTEEVNSISPISLDEQCERSALAAQVQSSGRTLQESTTDELVDMASNLSLKPEAVSGRPALKLPHLFILSPNSGKNMNAGKRPAAAAQPNRLENTPEKSAAPLLANDNADVAAEEAFVYARNLRYAVREAALSGPSSTSEFSEDKSSDGGSEHFFVPLSNGVFWKEPDSAVSQRKQLPFSSHPGIDEPLEHVFSPTFVMDDSFLEGTYEDLLAPLSETDAALMDSPGWLQHNLPTASSS